MTAGASSEGPPENEKAIGEDGHLAGLTDVNGRATTPTESVKREALIPRSRTPEPPYCWQSKAARRHIREKMNGHESTSSLLSLYDAFTEQASNEGKETFTAGQPYLGTLAGLSVRTVQRLEPLLEEFGMVEIHRPKLRGHNTYTLLAFGQDVATFGQDGLTLRHARISPPCRPVEVTKEVIEKKQRKNRSQEVTSDFIAQQQAFFPHLNVEQEFGKAKAWLSARPGRRMTRRFFVDWLKRAEAQPTTSAKEEW
jgi:hypothetical protein